MWGRPHAALTFRNCQPLHSKERDGYHHVQRGLAGQHPAQPHGEPVQPLSVWWSLSWTAGLTEGMGPTQLILHKTVLLGPRGSQMTGASGVSNTLWMSRRHRVFIAVNAVVPNGIAKYNRLLCKRVCSEVHDDVLCEYTSGKREEN